MPADAPDALTRDPSPGPCPSCDAHGGPVARVLDLRHQTGGSIVALSVLYPEPSAAIVELVALAQMEWARLESSVRTRAMKAAGQQKDPTRRRRRRR